MNNDDPRTAAEWLALGAFLRQNARFGEAINAFRTAAEAAEGELRMTADRQQCDALREIIKKSLASVELMQEINCFVNTDLMNP